MPNKKQQTSKMKNQTKFLLLFAIIFAAVGGFVLIKSFAASQWNYKISANNTTYGQYITGKITDRLGNTIPLTQSNGNTIYGVGLNCYQNIGTANKAVKVWWSWDYYTGTSGTINSDGTYKSLKVIDKSTVDPSYVNYLDTTKVANCKAELWGLVPTKGAHIIDTTDFTVSP